MTAADRSKGAWLGRIDSRPPLPSLLRSHGHVSAHGSLLPSLRPSPPDLGPPAAPGKHLEESKLVSLRSLPSSARQPDESN